MAQTSEEVFQALRQIVHNDPALQARLFKYVDPGDFLTAVWQLAQCHGLELEDGELQQAMGTGRKSWGERNVP